VRTVLIDLDGTLVDSAAGIMSHLAAALGSEGLPVPPDDVLRRFVGPPFESELPELGLTADQVAAVIVTYRASYNAVAAAVSPPFPGARELLEQLRGEGFRLALATAKPEHTARDVVETHGFAPHLELVAGAHHLAGRVGKALVIASALERLGLDPAVDDVVMVGDRHHDVEGAAEHGVPTIGVRWGYAEPGELDDAVLVVDTFDDLRAALLSADVWSTTRTPAA